jgi:hypothetical protein
MARTYQLVGMLTLIVVLLGIGLAAGAPAIPHRDAQQQVTGPQPLGNTSNSPVSLASTGDIQMQLTGPQPLGAGPGQWVIALSTRDVQIQLTGPQPLGSGIVSRAPQFELIGPQSGPASPTE